MISSGILTEMISKTILQISLEIPPEIDPRIPLEILRWILPGVHPEIYLEILRIFFFRSSYVNWLGNFPREFHRGFTPNILA